jgi:hypothetical protein
MLKRSMLTWGFGPSEKTVVMMWPCSSASMGNPQARDANLVSASLKIDRSIRVVYGAALAIPVISSTPKLAATMA